MSSTATTSDSMHDRSRAGRRPLTVRARPAAGTAATLLDYALLQEPDPLQASGSAALTVVVSNPGRELVTCSSIVVLLATGTSAKDLTASPDGIVVSAPEGWSAQRTAGVVTLSPDTGAAPIGASGLTFVLASIAVNDQPGTTVLVIAETAFTASQPSAARMAHMPVAKFPAQFALGSLYVTDPADYVVAYAGTATLMWTGSAAASATYTISYEPADDDPAVTAPVGAIGPFTSQALTRANAVTFTLTATYAVPGQDQPLVAVRQAMVSVQTVSLAFAVAPPAVGVNGLVRLEWNAPNAAYCTLEDGTRLAATGVAYLVLAATRTFTLSACAADGTELQQQQLTVSVDPSIVPTVPGYSIAGAPGLTGTPARCNTTIPWDPGTPGGPGGDGGDAILRGPIPPLDRTVRPARVIPITVQGGRGGDGGAGVVCGPFVAEIGMILVGGGAGGNGGNAVIDVAFDPSLGAPAQYVVTLQAGPAGTGGHNPPPYDDVIEPSGTDGSAWMRIADPGHDTPRLEAT